ncbi:MAG: hypothetical protein Q9M28_10870 [Mariprofundaceae bacterium]|nr:hypothetical protein [Mariprofundaceae bacterium]
MGFFKSIFSKSEPEPTARSLDHASDLEPKDIVKFGFSAQQILSNQSFKVRKVQTLDTGGEHKKKTLFTLEGSDKDLRLSVEDNDAELALQIYPDDVSQIFNVDDFVEMLDPDSGVHHMLKSIGKPEDFAGWVGSTYRQESGQNAYLYNQDYRQHRMPTDGSTGHEFSYYKLITDDRKYALEVHVLDGGQTNVYLIAYLALNKIEELWPSAA